jgi:HSP90 family molecular chaperone
MADPTTAATTASFKAETRQLLNILIHSLYSEREVFLRELVSNASDALTRINYEMLTQREVLHPDAELAIWITADPTTRRLTIRDSGIGMTAEELAENLGTIAHSGARAFLQAAQDGQGKLQDIIGQFGVGFYSAFMVADSIKVTSRSYQPNSPGAVWTSNGEDTYTIEPAEVAERGTIVEIHLKEDAAEFTELPRLREIIKRHSDFVPFPIYLGEDKEQANQQTALWRKSTRELTKEEAEEFYRQYTLDFNEPQIYAHLNIDAPVQLYALLFIPTSAERSMFALRKEDGLKLYARKVLIQEYCRDLLPEYFRFVQGVVDSEDIPLNVSRETVQASRVMPQLRRILTNKVADLLKELATNQPEQYAKFWQEFGRFIKEGIATDHENQALLAPLLQFQTLKSGDLFKTLDAYLESIPAAQTKIYYILGDDPRAITRSPHLDLYRKQDVDVLLLTDPLDSFVLLSLPEYQEHKFVNVATEKPEAPANEELADQKNPALEGDQAESLFQRIKNALGDKVEAVRGTDRLTDSPARLVDKEGSLQQEVQRAYRLLRQDFQVPQQVLEVNPGHELIKRLANLSEGDPRADLIINQVYEDALLIEGLHPDPAGMIERIQKIMLSALD